MPTKSKRLHKFLKTGATLFILGTLYTPSMSMAFVKSKIQSKSVSHIAVDQQVLANTVLVENRIDPSTQKKIAFAPVWYTTYLLRPYGLTYQLKDNRLYLYTSGAKASKVPAVSTRPSNDKSRLYVYLNGKPVESMLTYTTTDPYSGKKTLLVPIWYMDQVFSKINIAGSWNGSIHSHVWNLTPRVDFGAIVNGIPKAIVGSSFVVDVKPVSLSGVPLGSGHSVVLINGSGEKVTATWNAQDQTYQAVVTPPAVAGNLTFKTLIDGSPLPVSSVVSVVSSGGTPDSSQSKIQATQNTNGTVTVSVSLADKNGTLIGSGQTISVTTSSGQVETATWNPATQGYQVVLPASVFGSTSGASSGSSSGTSNASLTLSVVADNTITLGTNIAVQSSSGSSSGNSGSSSGSSSSGGSSGSGNSGSSSGTTVSSISVMLGDPTINASGTLVSYALSATALNSSAQTLVNQDITWSIQGGTPNGVTINESTGELQINSTVYSGTGFTIVASDNGVTKTDPVTYSKPSSMPTNMSVDLGTPSVSADRATISYTPSVTVLDQYGNVMAEQSVTWSIQGGIPNGVIIDSASGALSVNTSEYSGTGFTIEATNSQSSLSSESSIGLIHVTASQSTATSVDLSWNSVAGASSYAVYALGGTTPLATGITGTSTVIKNLTPAASYSFVVEALNSSHAIDVGSAASITLSAGSVILGVSPTQAVGGGNVTVTGRVYDSQMHAASGVSVSLSGTLGYWNGGVSDTTVTTDGNGEFQATFTTSSTTSQQQASVTASVYTSVYKDVYGATLYNGSSTAFVTLMPPLTLNITSLPDALEQQAYSQTLSVAGGFAPYTFKVVGGSLPTGITLNTATGVISGVVSTTGVSQVSIQVTDSLGNTLTQSLSLSALASNTTTIKDATSDAGKVVMAISGSTITVASGTTVSQLESAIQSTDSSSQSYSVDSSGVLTNSDTLTVTAENGTTTQAYSIQVSADGTIVDTIPVGSGAMNLAYGNGDVYVANWSSNTVSVINTSTNTVTATVAVQASPYAVTYGNGNVYVTATNTNINYVDVIDASTDTFTATVPVGYKSSGGFYTVDSGANAVAYGNGYVYVANQNLDYVNVIDASTNQFTANGPVCSAPDGVAYAYVNGHGYVYVANDIGGTVSVIDASTNTVTATVPVGYGSLGITYGNGNVYVANSNDNTVSVIDASTNKVTATVPVGNFPTGIAYGNGYVYVTNQFDFTVSVIDASTNTVTKIVNLPVGSYPDGVAYSNGYVYVVNANAGTGTVSVIKAMQ